MKAPGSRAGLNPADDAELKKRLARELSRHAERLARKMPEEAAVAWVHMTALVAWAEDHGLISPFLRKPDAVPDQAWRGVPPTWQGRQALGMAALCCHPSTWCLLDPKWSPVHEAKAAEAECRDLGAWWRDDAPSFLWDGGSGPSPETGWLAGELLQGISATRRKGNALVQTPWWVADHILDYTLLPAAGDREFPGGTALRVIDPACGTGHFLVLAIGRLWEWYTTGVMPPGEQGRELGRLEPVTGGKKFPPGQAARMILQGLHGAEIDPYTAAVARLRYTVTLGRLVHDTAPEPRGPFRLDRIPRFEVPVIPADSLLAGAMPADEYAALHPGLASIVNIGQYPGREAGLHPGLAAQEALW